MTKKGILAEATKYAPPIGTRITGKPVQTVASILIPQHLREFWRKYNDLLNEGWFDKVEKFFEDNPDKLAEELTTYGRALIFFTKNEKDTQKKYDYYQALTKFIQYLGGKLGQ